MLSSSQDSSYYSRPFISSLFDLVRALTFSCSLRSCFMTQFSLGRRDSMVITSSPSPSESELVSSSLVTSFFFLVPFLGSTFSHSELKSVASSHVPFLGSCFFFLAPPLAMKHMGGGESGLSHLIAIPVTSSSSKESSYSPLV